MIVGMITGKKVFWNCGMDVITSRIEYRSSVFIETVFETTFSFPNILWITQATLNQILLLIISSDVDDFKSKLHDCSFLERVL